MRHWLQAGALALALLGATVAAGGQASNGAEKAGKVTVTVDTRQVVDVVAWAAQARKLALEWYPRIVDILGAKPPKEAESVRLVFENMNGVAGTGGATIHISIGWVQQHPEDRGMVIHELAHVIQSYPKYDPVWLIEGIADYVRWWRFEPKPSPLPRNLEKASYRDSYRTTAAFLAYVEREHPGTIRKAHAVLRAGSYRDALFEEWTGKSLDALWADFVKANQSPQ